MSNVAMERVQRAFEAWAALSSKCERAEFLSMMRSAYARQRKAELLAAPGAPLSNLSQVALTAGDIAAFARPAALG